MRQNLANINKHLHESSDVDSLDGEVTSHLPMFSSSGDNFIPSEGQSSSTSSESIKSAQPKKRSRWKKADPDSWQRNVNKKRKMSGLSYKTSKGLQPAQTPKNIDCGSCRYKCSLNFNDEVRNNLCAEYWKLDYNRQKDFILACVKSVLPKCRRIRTGTGVQKNTSRVYHFMKNGTKYRVCKRFFLGTLSISHGPIHNALSSVNDAGIFAGTDKRGRKAPGNKTSSKIIADIKAHIQSFPVMESHYCRKSTKREYLDSNLSITKMYALYVEQCKEKTCNLLHK